MQICKTLFPLQVSLGSWMARFEISKRERIFQLAIVEANKTTTQKERQIVEKTSKFAEDPVPYSGKSQIYLSKSKDLSSSDPLFISQRRPLGHFLCSKRTMPSSLTLQTDDGRCFPISNKAAAVSECLKCVIEQEFYNHPMFEKATFVIQIPNIDGSTMERIIFFMNHHSEEPRNDPAVPTASSSSLTSASSSSSFSNGGSTNPGNHDNVETGPSSTTTPPPSPPPRSTTTSTTSPSPSQNDDDTDTTLQAMTGLMDFSWYDNFLPNPTTIDTIRLVLQGAHQLMIRPLISFMYIECLMYIASRYGRLPTFEEVSRFRSFFQTDSLLFRMR